MVNLSRRAFVAAASAIPFPVWAEQQLKQVKGQPLVRYDATSPNGLAMLKIYADGVGRMQALNTGNPQSWNFQWYIHCVPGSSSPAQQGPQKSAALAAAYPPGTPAQKVIAQAAWNTCQAHYSGLEDYFLPWHRMYVFYLENVIRAVTGASAFTLPYWDYSAAGPTHGVLPPQFRLPNDPLYKYLYVGKRNTTPAVNAGAPIDQFDPGALALTALDRCRYSNVGSVTGFCQTLDFGLHGNVHVDTGAGQNMGAVPWAAGDPIFWMHHSNIDRLWASWNKGGRSNPSTASFLNQSFTFSAGNGTIVTAKIGDVLDIAPLGYTYDRFEPVKACLRIPKTTFTSLARINLAIGKGPVHAQLRAVVSKSSTGKPIETGLRKNAAQLKTEEGIYLVLSKIEVGSDPGVLYHVYLGLPEGVDPKAGDKYKVGVINFFHGAGHALIHGTGPAYSFDVTDLVKSLGDAITDEPRVSVVPLGEGAAEAKVTIGEASLVRQ